jgi:hypothetical protein
MCASNESPLTFDAQANLLARRAICDLAGEAAAF